MIGLGIAKGMAVTMRNFVGSYFEEDRLTTVQYPEERSPLPENYRNFPILIFDGEDAPRLNQGFLLGFLQLARRAKRPSNAPQFFELLAEAPDLFDERADEALQAIVECRSEPVAVEAESSTRSHWNADLVKDVLLS